MGDRRLLRHVFLHEGPGGVNNSHVIKGPEQSGPFACLKSHTLLASYSYLLTYAHMRYGVNVQKEKKPRRASFVIIFLTTEVPFSLS